MEMEMEMEMVTETETKRRRISSMETETKTETKRRSIMDAELKFVPPEMYSEILSRLPADSAIGCRLICKPWRSLIDHPAFIDAHTLQVISSSPIRSEKFGNYLIPNSSSSSSGFLLFAQQERSSFQLQFVEYNDYVEKLAPEFKPSKPLTYLPFPFFFDYWGILLISSCNGLVFMGSTKPNFISDMFVCNPFTREYVNLRSATTTDGDDDARIEERIQERKGRMSYGFGYLPSTNEYKVVSICYPNLYGGNGKVRVYTLGSGRWRNKGEIPYWVYTEYHSGFFANGAIHWFTNATKKQKIVSFDLADEEFRMVVPLPPPSANHNHVDKLGVLGEFLCMTRSDSTRCESPKDIWVLNVHNTKQQKKKFSWEKRFTIPWKGTTSAAIPQVVLKSGKILLLGDFGLISYDSKTEAFNEDGLISYDSKTEAFSEDEDGEGIFHNPNKLRVVPYTKSFVSLKALGEKDAKFFGKSFVYRKALGEKDAKFFRGGVSRALAKQPH